MGQCSFQSQNYFSFSSFGNELALKIRRIGFLVSSLKIGWGPFHAVGHAVGPATWHTCKTDVPVTVHLAEDPVKFLVRIFRTDHP